MSHQPHNVVRSAARRGTDVRRSPDVPAPPVPAIERTPGHLIRRAQQVHTALWADELHGDLTGPQYALLSALSRSGPLDQQSASRLASLDKATTAGVVARLERDGWVRRARDAGDARRNVLMLPGVARTALRDVTQRVRAVQERLLEPLDPACRDRFVVLLSRIAFAGGPVPVARVESEELALGLGTTPGHLLRRAEQVHAGLWAATVGDRSTPPQYALLCALVWRPDADQRAAGEMASLDKSSTADVVARLVRRGLVVSTREPSDRRRKVLALSASAHRLITDLEEPVRDVQQRLVEPLASEERTKLGELLRRVAYRATA